MRKTIILASILMILIMAIAMTSCGGDKGGGQANKAPEETPTPTSPQTTPTKGAVTAQEAMQLLVAKAKQWSSDAMPVTLGAISRGRVIEGGKCDNWGATFYSASKKEAYVFNYYQGQLSQAGKPMFQGVDWQVSDILSSWNVNSPQAASIAASKGIPEITTMELFLSQYSDRNPPQAVPPTCQAYWEIGGNGGEILYINAANGEFLGWKR